MARDTSKTADNLVKLGVKYGPLLYETVKRGQGPAKEMAQREAAKAGSKRRALEHAYHLVDGSVLTVYDGDRRTFVVFNGDTPVAAHPATARPLEQLVAGYDLAKRIRPRSRRDRLTPRVLKGAPRPGGAARQDG